MHYPRKETKDMEKCSVALQIAIETAEDAYKAVKLAEDYNYSKIIMEVYDDLVEFMETISKANVDRYTFHARSAI